MSKNEQKTNEENNASILQSYIDTKQAHDLLFQWIEKQNSETYVRDHFFLNKMIKNYYGCIGFWFKTKAINPQEKPLDIIITVPGSNKVPDAVIELSKNDNFRKFEQEQKNYTPILISEEEAEPRAYELLKKQYPTLFDEFGKLTEETELLGTFLVAIPIWEGTYNSKYGREHKFYIDAQTGEVTGDLYNDKSKINKKPTKRLTAKDLEKLNTNSDKTDITAKTEKEKINNSESKKEEKVKSQKPQKSNENRDDVEDNKETEEDERKRYVLIALIVLAIAILLFIFSQILKPNHDPNKPNPHNTSITAQQKPKYTPPPKDKVDNKTKIERETPEKFVDSIIKKLISQKYKEINELISKNPDEVIQIEEGYTNITSMFRDLGQLEDYYSKTTSIFPEKTTKIFGKTEKNKDVSENVLSDGSAIPSVIKEQAKEENNLISISTSYIETYKDSSSEATEKKDRTILIFTLSTEDNKTKVKSVHRKYETVDDSAISQIIEKESNSYSEISQKQPDENKEEQKQKEENNNSNENIQQQPEKKVEIPVSQKPHINLIPKGSTYVEDEPTKQEEKNIKKESIQQVETEPAINQTNSATTPNNTTSSSSEGSDFGSAGGSVQ